VKVLFTVPWGERLGGAEVMLHHYLLSLDGDRVQPAVVFLRDGAWRRELEAEGIATEVVPSGRLRQPHALCRAAIQLAGVLRRRRPDVLMNWSAKSHLYGGLARRLSGVHCPVVWWQHNVPRPQWLDRLATYVPADAIGCSSRASAEHQGVVTPRRRLFVVHPGVPSPPLNGATLATPERSGDLVAGLVGRLEPGKGHDRLMRAIALVRGRGVAVRGLLVGGDAWGLSPRYASELATLRAKLGLAEHVELAGQVEDVWPHLLAMDMVISASERESFGIAVIEAMAAGRPVVAPRGAAGPAEIVIHEETGLLVSEASAEALADAIERLARDPVLRRRLGREARLRYEARYTAGAMGQSLTAELERIAAG
jgi:glycosyltransferase involved in cell wall biosynthesis